MSRGAPGQPRAKRGGYRNRPAERFNVNAAYADMTATCLDCGLDTTVGSIKPCMHCGRETCPRCREDNSEASRTCCAIERNERQPKFVVQGA